MASQAIAGQDTATWIERCIRDYAASAENRLDPQGDAEPAWAAPLVGFSRGGDPLFRQFKEDIGPFLWTPAEAFAAALPGIDAPAAELTVISWVLPQTAATRADNARERTFPARRWALARKYGEEFNARLRAHVVQRLTEAGFPAVAPLSSPLCRQEISPRYGLAATWSERHAAYACGLGTFGLCDGLITPRGKAMRLGSVVARITTPPTERPYDDPHAYCLYFVDGSCGRCADRCPVGAVTREGGHDKAKCKEYLQPRCEETIRERFGFRTYACGLCQTGVPCEARIPVPVGAGQA